MKKTISLLILFLCLILLFVHPMLTVSAAANGLMLWYQNILPALLPFAILSNILISSGVFYHISGILYPFIHLLIPCSRNACFPLLSGFLHPAVKTYHRAVTVLCRFLLSDTYSVLTPDRQLPLCFTGNDIK